MHRVVALEFDVLVRTGNATQSCSILSLMRSRPALRVLMTALPRCHSLRISGDVQRVAGGVSGE